MTTSYVLERQQELKELKALERAAEASAMQKAMEEAVAKKKASDARIAAKMKRIESGDAAPAIEKAEAAVSENVSAAPKKSAIKKKAPKKLKRTPKRSR